MEHGTGRKNCRCFSAFFMEPAESGGNCTGILPLTNTLPAATMKENAVIVKDP